MCSNSLASYSCQCAGTGYEGTHCDSGRFLLCPCVQLIINENISFYFFVSQCGRTYRINSLRTNITPSVSSSLCIKGNS